MKRAVFLGRSVVTMLCIGCLVPDAVGQSATSNFRDRSPGQRLYAIVFDIPSSRFGEVVDITGAYDRLHEWRSPSGSLIQDSLKFYTLGPYLPARFVFYDADGVFLLLNQPSFAHAYSVTSTLTQAQPQLPAAPNPSQGIGPIQLPDALSASYPLVPSVSQHASQDDRWAELSRLLQDPGASAREAVDSWIDQVEVYKTDISGLRGLQNSLVARVDDLIASGERLLLQVPTPVSAPNCTGLNPRSSQVAYVTYRKEVLDFLSEVALVADLVRSADHAYGRMTDKLRSALSTAEFLADLDQLLGSDLLGGEPEDWVNQLLGHRDVNPSVEALSLDAEHLKDEEARGVLTQSFKDLKEGRSEISSLVGDLGTRLAKAIGTDPSPVALSRLSLIAVELAHKTEALADFSPRCLLPEEPLLIASRIDAFNKVSFELNRRDRFGDIAVVAPVRAGESPGTGQKNKAGAKDTAGTKATTTTLVFDEDNEAQTESEDANNGVNQAPSEKTDPPAASAQPAAGAEEKKSPESVVLAAGRFDFRKTYHFRIAAGYGFSRIRSEAFGTATRTLTRVDENDLPVLDGSGNPVTTVETFVVAKEDRSSFFSPMLMLIYYPWAVDVSRGASGPHRWLPGATFGVTLTRPKDDFFLGLALEFFPGMQFAIGKQWALRSRLRDGFQPGSIIPNGSSAPVVESRESSVFFAAVIEAGLFANLLGKTIGIVGN